MWFSIYHKESRYARGARAAVDAGRLHSQIDLISMQIRSTRRSRCLEGPVSATDRPKGLNPSRFHTLQARNERGSGPAADTAAERDPLVTGRFPQVAHPPSRLTG